MHNTELKDFQEIVISQGSHHAHGWALQTWSILAEKNYKSSNYSFEL